MCKPLLTDSSMFGKDAGSKRQKVSSVYKALPVEITHLSQGKIKVTLLKSIVKIKKGE